MIVKRRKSKNIYADFETTAYQQYLKEGRTRVYLGGFINDEADDITVFGSIEGFFKALKSELKGYTDLNIYFHNLAFDVSFIIWYLNDLGYTHYVRKKDEWEQPESTYDLFINAQGQIYTLTLNYYGVRLTFKDSLKKLPASIKKLGKIVGLDKLDETHNYSEDKPTYHSVAEIPQEEIDYLRNDILILRKAMQSYAQDTNFANTLTSASNSYNTWLDMTFPRDMSIHSYFKQVQALKDKCRELLPIIENDEMNDIISKSYRGGITYVNPKYQGKEVHGISFDVNSLYPFAMISGAYPCGQPRFVTEYNPNHLQLITFFVTEAVCDDMLPFVPTKQIGKSYEYASTLPTGFYTLWVEEFELFKKYYESDYIISSILEFDEVTHLFDKYINYFADIKCNTTDEGIRYMTKLRLNGLGGKFGTKTYQVKKRCVGNTNKLGGLQFELLPPEVGEVYYRAISSRMTSVARCYLIKHIAQNWERFIYCDTDSIYLYGYEEPKGIYEHPTQLGAWKREHKFERGKFLHTKCYVISDNGKLSHSIAGCSQNAKQSITLDNFEMGMTVPKGNLKALQVKGGVVLAPTDFTITVR